MRATQQRISSAAVEKATGNAWDAWFALLDRAGAAKKTHKEIVRLVRGLGLASPWWQQMVTVSYEHARGLRTVGQTAATGFEIGVQETLPVPPRKAWQLLVKRPGRDVWLGILAQFQLRKGAAYVTSDGAFGEVRSVAPGEYLRLTWQAAERQKPTTLQIRVVPGRTGTSVRIHHEKLENEAERRRMRQHWRCVLKQLHALVDDEQRAEQPKARSKR